MQIALLLVY